MQIRYCIFPIAGDVLTWTNEAWQELQESNLLGADLEAAAIPYGLTPMALAAGFEPATRWLTANRSTVELH
jgi:hypothetical protein